MRRFTELGRYRFSVCQPAGSHPRSERLRDAAAAGHQQWRIGEPQVVIGVVRVRTKGRKFKISDELTVLPEHIQGLIEKAKHLE